MNIVFKKLHDLIHCYEVPNLNEKLVKYKEELIKEGKKFHEYLDKFENLPQNNFTLSNPELEEYLHDLFSYIANKFYITGPTYDIGKGIGVYYQTKEKYSNVFHNHHTSTLVGTTYIDPNLIEEGGEIEFMNHPNKIHTIKPQINCIYMFPGWLLHRPLPHNSSSSRICFNWAYNGSRRPLNKFSGDIW